VPPVHPFHEFPKHLFHPSKPSGFELTEAEMQALSRLGAPGPVVAHNREDEAIAIKAGYSEEYVPQEYPKAVTIGEDKDGNPVQRTVQNAEEEKALLASLAPAEDEKES
jgi:hypothetical protein